MTSAEAFIRRRMALSYLQRVGQHAQTFSEHERNLRLKTARTSYQKADKLYRKLAAKGK